MSQLADNAVPPGSAVRLLRAWSSIALWKRILAALILGAAVGLAWGEGARSIAWIGDLFIRLIRMVVVPLVFMIIASGIAGLGDTRKLGAIGGKSVLLYFCSMLIASTIGLALAFALQPGVGVQLGDIAPQAVTEPRTLAELFLGIVPPNPIKAMAEADMLGVIFFGVMVGIAIVVAGKPAEPAARVLQAGADIMLQIVVFVMAVAPLGVFALMAVVMGTVGPGALVNILWLVLCVSLGALIQVAVVQGGIVRVLARLPLIPFFRGIADAMLVGFSTTSSSATLPVSIRVAEENLGIAQPVTSTVLPLGVSVGLDGTALYVAALTVFAAQAFGVPLTLADYAVIVVVTTIAVMGAAPVPSGSLFVLAAVLGAVGIGGAQSALIVGFILPFDRILDMIRTVPNITADLAIATAVARSEGELDVETYRSPRDV